MKLSRILRKYREDNKVSMDAFASKAGVSKSYISMIENDKNARDDKPISPTLTTLAKLADAMNIGLDNLLELMDADADIVVNEESNVASDDELELLAAFRRLNNEGRKEAIRRVLEMAEIARYTEDTALNAKKAN